MWMHPDQLMEMAKKEVVARIAIYRSRAETPDDWHAVGMALIASKEDFYVFPIRHDIRKFVWATVGDHPLATPFLTHAVARMSKDQVSLHLAEVLEGKIPHDPYARTTKADLASFFDKESAVIAVEVDLWSDRVYRQFSVPSQSTLREIWADLRSRIETTRSLSVAESREPLARLEGLIRRSRREERKALAVLGGNRVS